MAQLSSRGISAWLPGGFEGRIFQREASAGSTTFPVGHFATFALPAEVADFGGGVPAAMGPTDIFAVLFEYGQESMGRALFARQGMPRSLSAAQFRPYTLRRGAAGQSGTQWFFTENGRPFTFYAVLGSHALRAILVPRVNALLGGISVMPLAATSASGAPGGS
jgi:hypothetical protein